MKFSKLQQFILVGCLRLKEKKILRREFLRIYENHKKMPQNKEATKIITKSLERLIKRNFIVGFGEITSQKIFIESVRLTRAGRQEVRKILDRRQRLPLKVKSLKSKVKS